MAPVLSFINSLRSNHSAIIRIRKKVLQEDATRLHQGYKTKYRPGKLENIYKVLAVLLYLFVCCCLFSLSKVIDNSCVNFFTPAAGFQT